MAPIIAGGAALFACGGQDGGGEARDVAAPPQAANGAAGAPPHRSGADITADDLAFHIANLASDAFEGRAPGAPGGDKARRYIAEAYGRLGMGPVGEDYFQAVPLIEATLDPENSYFRIHGQGEEIALEYKKDIVYWTKRVEERLRFEDSDLVFAGYGIVAPEYGWNDYDGVDVAGKTVVILVNDPGFATQDPDLFNGAAMTYYGRWTYKYEEAARQGAAAALIIHDEKPAAYGWGVVEGSWSGPQLDLERADGAAARVIAEGWLSNDRARALAGAAGHDLDALQEAALSPDFKPIPLNGLAASAALNTALRRSQDANVIGFIKGAERPDEYVLYMAHWDHLGVNPTTEGDDKIFNGAVDNATGVAAILEIAEKFATRQTPPARSILLAAVTAEESGLLGSAYMAENPPVPLEKIVGGVNIDALLPTPPAKDMIVVGAGASELEDVLRDVAAARDVYLRPDPEPEKGYFYRSDHISLAKKGVPMLYADAGLDLRDGGEDAGGKLAEDYLANRYHSPQDEFDGDWNMAGITEAVQILYELGAHLADSNDWPNWREDNEFRALRDAQRGAED